MKELIFITTNIHKVEEVIDFLKKYNIKIKQVKMDYEEDKEADMEEISKKAAKYLANKLKKPVIVEDTGLFFKAYNNFPGAQPKFVINSIGFDGIFRLLEGKNREAYFYTAIGYCAPKSQPKLFIGKMSGKITSKVIKPKIKAMPYDHIFVPEGSAKTIVEMSLNEKNILSQRGEAARKLGKYLKNKVY